MFPRHIFPNFNIPPPVIPQKSLEEDVDTKIATFLKNHSLEPENSIPDFSMERSKANLRLSDINQKLNNLEQLKNNLEKIFEELKLNVEKLSEEEWQKKMIESKNLQEKIDFEINFLHENRPKIQRLIKKRQNKRTSRKNRKILSRDQQNRVMSDRKMKHQEIDRNLKEIQIKLNAEKQAATEKEETQTTLASVHKRIREAKERLELFESLIKIRQITKQQSQRPERDVNEESFFEEISRMKTLWNLALEQHLEEEWKLEEYLSNKFRPQQTIEQQWNEVIFGATTLKKIDHPLLRAEKSLNDFLTIRHEWDACVSTNGSSIPLFWVLPNKNDGDWQLYRN